MKKWLIIIAILPFVACSHRYVPKPKGYFRITMPDTVYTTFSDPAFPYQFDYCQLTNITPHNTTDEPYWIDIRYPMFNSKLHCSYKPIEGNLRQLTDDAQSFVYKHANMASSIPQQGFSNQEQHTYGVFYMIEGNTASPIQFYLTDSTNHFFRAALYYDFQPNQDSLAPVIEWLETDIRHIMETFKWK